MVCELGMADDRIKVVGRNLISTAHMEYIQGLQ